MKTRLRLAMPLLLAASLAGSLARGQDVAATAAGGDAAVPDRPQERMASFGNAAPVDGLAGTGTAGTGTAGMRTPARCSGDGTSYVEMRTSGGAVTNGGVAALPDLYRITHAGEASKVSRMVPTGYASFSVRDFFAGERSIVTLFSGMPSTLPEGGGGNAAHVFISASDEDGSHASVVELGDLKIDPLKIAVLESGRFLVTGMDAVDHLPRIVVLNEDGTLRRTIDLDEKKTPPQAGAAGGTTRPTASKNDVRTADTARRRLTASGNLVPFGSKVLLVRTGQGLPLQVLNEAGEERSIPLTVPTEYVLVSVLPSDEQSTLVARVRARDGGRSETRQPVQDRFLEFSAATGKALALVTVSGVQAAQVNCSANGELTAVYLDVTSAGDGGVAAGAGTAVTQQVVLASAPL